MFISVVYKPLDWNTSRADVLEEDLKCLSRDIVNSLESTILYTFIKMKLYHFLYKSLRYITRLKY